MIKRAHDAIERGELLQEFIPIPQELKDTISGGYGDPKKQAELEEKTKRNVEKYGYGNWYDFCVGEWGTKWDIGEQGCSDIHPDGLIMNAHFDSAWSPPVDAYYKLEELGFEVDAMFYEPGMSFAGTFAQGCCDDISLEGMTADDIEQNYPDLDQAFGISESIREWEEENEEEEEELTEWIKEGIEAKKEGA